MMINFFLQISRDTSYYFHFAYISLGVIIFSYALSLVIRARKRKKE